MKIEVEKIIGRKVYFTFDDDFKRLIHDRMPRRPKRSRIYKKIWNKTCQEFILTALREGVVQATKEHKDDTHGRATEGTGSEVS